uniref:AMMECR1 domain-containing protein n=1 Tax=Ascaris lumbricoides TaxID=6252 RepID=A0A0M3INL5_ASCLU
MSIVEVIADVIESNSRPPVFSKPLYEVSVKEDAEPGTCLLKILDVSLQLAGLRGG